MTRHNQSDAPPVPAELAGAIEAANTLITFLLGQRLGGNPDRVIAFTQWEKRVRAELAELQAKARLAIGRDKPEAAAVAGAVQ